jgi:methionine-rich copper-binding protein CopC
MGFPADGEDEPMLHTTGPAVRRAAVLLVALGLALLGAGAGTAAAATDEAPRVHHVFPEDGAVLATSPDHVEIMFDVLLVPGRVDVALAPDDTGRLVPLPSPPELDGPLLVQALPPLPAGHYTVGVRLLGTDGRLTGGTFGFTVDPAAPAAPAAHPGGAPGGTASWLVPAVAVALLVPAAALALARRRPRRPGIGVTRPRPAPGGGPSAPGRGAGRTPTSAS